MKYWRNPKLSIQDSQIHGSGLFATDNISTGELLLVVGGELMIDPDYKLFRKNNFNAPPGLNLIGDELWLVPLGVEKENSFLNHSCEPNAVIDGQIFWRALKTINTGDEVLTDYSTFTDLKDHKGFQCNCQSEFCRKTISFQDWKKDSLQKKYGTHFSSDILVKMSSSSKTHS